MERNWKRREREADMGRERVGERERDGRSGIGRESMVQPFFQPSPNVCPFVRLSVPLIV